MENSNPELVTTESLVPNIPMRDTETIVLVEVMEVEH